MCQVQLRKKQLLVLLSVLSETLLLLVHGVTPGLLGGFWSIQIIIVVGVKPHLVPHVPGTVTLTSATTSPPRPNARGTVRRMKLQW